MSNSRIVEPPRHPARRPGLLRLGLLGGILLLWAAGPALSQTEPPKKDGATAKPEAPVVGPPVRLGPHSVVPDARAAPGKPAPGTVRQQDLGAVNPESVGTLTAAKGGFGENMWRGTGRALVMDLVPRLPARSRSPVVRDLTRRLLLSKATAPRGLATGDSLTTLRGVRLYAMGDPAGAAALFSLAVPSGADSLRARAEIESLLLLGRRDEACKAKDVQLGFKPSQYLELATVVCHALAGDHGKASLAIGLLREQNADLSDAFIILVDAQQKGSRARLKNLPAPTGLTLAMLLNTKLRLPKDILSTREPALVRAIALSSNRPVAERIEAGERALAIGAINPAQMTKVYVAKPMRRLSPRAAGRLPLKKYDALARARLYQSVVAQNKEDRKLSILLAWWRLAFAKGDATMVARVTAPALSGIVPQAKYAEAAGLAARVLFLAGEAKLGLAWHRALGEAGFKDRGTSVRLAALARLAGGPGVTWSANNLAGWVAYQRKKHPAKAEKRILLLFALFDGLGDAAGEKSLRDKHVSSKLSATLTSGAPRKWRSTSAAARQGRRGETVLRVLEALGARRPGTMSPADLRFAIRSLSEIGLKAEARALAVEAAIGAGL